MKKLIIVAVAMCAAIVTNAAAVAWQVSSATADQKDYSVYVFASAVADKYDTFDALIANAVGSAGTIAEKSGRTGKTYSMASALTAQSDDLTGTLYAVLVSGSDAKDYIYGTIDASSKIYYPDQQQASPGTLTFSTSALTSSGTIGAVPEPTSGLLMLLGIAGLALRRRRA